jgi:hypothetical protein|tara:strand:- start:793 stop:1164 length:372 start_codon:yes stop_codon:yes gene_type:complete
MIRIAHRGNTKGCNKALENDPSYIDAATSLGHHCEVDVWFISGNFYLGHDEPAYPTDIDFLENDKLVCHAKNIEALHEMLKNPKVHCFWHEEDECTITSQGWVWKYPEIYLEGKLYGICSDWL